MTVTVTELQAGPFPATGAAQELPFEFKAFTDDEVAVVYGEGLMTLSPSLYTVDRNTSVVGAALEGGSVTLSPYAIEAGVDVYVVAAPTFDQQQIWSSSGSRLENLNEGLDRSVIRDLWLLKRLDEAVAAAGDLIGLVGKASRNANLGDLADLDAARINLGAAAASDLPITLTPAIYGGVTDGRALLVAADTIAQILGRAVQISGTLRVATSVTLTSRVVFTASGKIKPDNGVAVRLLKDFTAPLAQVFDLSAGGKVILPDTVGEVWAAWWGLNDVRLDNEVPLQQAVDALEGYWGDRTSPLAYSGGRVMLHRGIFKVSGPVTLRNIVRLVGVGRDYSRLFANAATWAGSRMIHSVNYDRRVVVTGITQAATAVVTSAAHGLVNGEVVTLENVGGMTQVNGNLYAVANVTANTFELTDPYTLVATNSTGFSAYTAGGTATTYRSQFGSRLEEIALNAGDIAAITDVVYAESWNEQCGMKHFLINNFRGCGIKVRKGYGGSAVTQLEEGEIMGNYVALQVGIDVEVSTGFTLSFMDFELHRVTVTGCKVSVSVANRVRLASNLVFTEDADISIFLSGEARLCGTGVKAQRDTVVVIGLDTNWSGRVDNLPVVQGPATKVLQDYRSGKANYRPFDGEFLPGAVTYPTGGKALFGGVCTGGGGAGSALGTPQLASFTRQSTGVYRGTLTTGFSLGLAAYYYGRAWPTAVTTGVTCELIPLTGAIFEITCRDAAGAVIDVAEIGFDIFHRP